MDVNTAKGTLVLKQEITENKEDIQFIENETILTKGKLNEATEETNKEDISLQRETWDSKLDFLLSVIGFAVDLGNIWRFPYICFKNGGGAFLIPYIIMYIFGGLPLFYLELALGQFQRCGCISVWRRICPMFFGIGFGICIIGSYTAFYYNTIISWALYYMFDSMRSEVPWASCNNTWNTEKCVSPFKRIKTAEENGSLTDFHTSVEEYYFLKVLQINNSNGFNDIGTVRWDIALCLMAVFIIVYFSLWKGVKSSGKAVWITATVPYVILAILLVRGLTLEGSNQGIKYYLTPNFTALSNPIVWSEAASQIFFSLGPGFGVLLALSSYNRFHNNCYRDAMVTSFVNCFTSFISGFVVFSVLGHMSHRMKKEISEIATEGPALVFLAYPEAIATMKGSVFFSIIFFLMLITLGLDSTFAGLESIITAILDEFPNLRKYRKFLVLTIIIYCFIGALATTTNGGYLIVTLLDINGAPVSILFIVFCECIALCWFYGVDRFSQDVKQMLGFCPGKFWLCCWGFICPTVILGIFISTCITKPDLSIRYLDKELELPKWVTVVSWLIVFSSLIFIPICMIISFIKAKGSFTQRLREITTPLPSPNHVPPRVRDREDLTIWNIGAFVKNECKTRWFQRRTLRNVIKNSKPDQMQGEATNPGDDIPSV